MSGTAVEARAYVDLPGGVTAGELIHILGRFPGDSVIKIVSHEGGQLSPGWITLVAKWRMVGVES